MGTSNISRNLCDCSYTRTLKGTTPYELWFQGKPYVAHLREFGTPVWVLLQGQAIERKMLPKSQRRAYVGYEEGPKAIKYYNAETRKVLTSRNFRFLSPPIGIPSPEAIVVAPDVRREGELGRNTPLISSDPQGAQSTGDSSGTVHPTRNDGDSQGDMLWQSHGGDSSGDKAKKRKS